MLTHLSLFSGIGGLDLAAEAAGFTTVGQCEIDGYATKILERHWPGVARWKDIKTLTKEDFHGRTGLDAVDIVSGGFPCQPFSVAGKQRGKDDDRYLWPEMLRVISAVRPAWVLGENVAGFIRMALDEAVTDLEAIGYACQAYCVPAGAVDAPHSRARVALVAYDADRKRDGDDVADARHAELQGWKDTAQRRERAPQDEPAPCCGDVPHPDGDRCQECIWAAIGNGEEIARGEGLSGDVRDALRRRRGRDAWRQNGKEPAERCSREPEPGLGRVAHGLPFGLDGIAGWPPEPDIPRVALGKKDRTNRIKCLGNAVVPAQFYPFFAAIAAIERPL